MTLKEMTDFLASHGVYEDELYSIGGLGGGEIDGIELIDGVWHTYFSERGSKNSIKKWNSEAEAVQYIVVRAEKLARLHNLWRDPKEE